jgi:single-stranded DNA-binding protein
MRKSAVREENGGIKMQGKLQDGSVIICGILPRDAECRTVGEKGSSLTTFSVKAGERAPLEGERYGEAIWVSCKCWHAAARATASLKKGDTVLCVGKIEKYFSEQNGKEYTNLVCEFVVPMNGAVRTESAYAPTQPVGNPDTFAADDFEVFSDDGVPF